MKKYLIPIFLFIVASAVSAQSTSKWSEAPPDLKLFENIDMEYYSRQYSIGDPYFGMDWLRENYRDFFNDWGYKAYLAGDLLQAAIFWSAAVQFDETHALAHYNLACVLAIFMQGFENREYFSYRSSVSPEYSQMYATYLQKVLQHLKIAIVLDPNRLHRVAEDPDLATLPDIELVHIVLAGPHPKAEDVLKNFPEWFSIQGGASTPEDQLTFFPDRRVRFKYDIELRRRLFSESETDFSFSGSWRIDNEMIIIETDDGRTVTGSLELRLDESGFIERRKLILQGLGPFGDYETHYWTMQDA